MKEWTIFIIIAIVLIIFLYAVFELLFRPRHVKYEIVKNPKQLKDFIETYGDSYKFQVHNVSDLEEPYAKVMYMVNYKKSIRNPKDVQEISREIAHIDYYIKL